MNGDGRRELEYRADMTRARLIGTIEALDRKGRELFDWRLQLRRRSRELVGGFAGILAGVLVTAGVGLYRAKRRTRHRREERLRALGRLWSYPERVAPRGSVIGTVARMLLVAITSMATTTLAMREVERQRKRPRLPRPPTEPLGV